MKRIIAIVVMTVMVFGIACAACAEERKEIALTTAARCAEIFREICEEYNANGTVDDEKIYIAGIYYELYLEAYRVWLVESLIEKGKGMDDAKEVLETSRDLFDSFDDVLSSWIKTKDKMYSDAIMNIINQELSKK